MSSTAEFIFESYSFDWSDGVLRLAYAFRDGPRFEERLRFPGKLRDLSPDERAAFDRAVRLLFLLAGVSYYKTSVPPRLRCAAFPLDAETASLIQEIYLKGLAEFSYRNKIDLRGRLEVLSQAGRAPTAPRVGLPQRCLVPVGGGKDSIVSIESFKRAGRPIGLFALATGRLAAPIRDTIAISGLDAICVERSLSPNLFELNKAGALNGHVPITAIVSACAVVSAILYGFDTVVLSNEHSASAPNLVVDDAEINHQYSKSLEFEAAFADYVVRHVSADLAYFSLLRPLTETAIAARFAKNDAYDHAFRSCNAVFRQDEQRVAMRWCCDCPKCRFVFLALAPFMVKERLLGIFGSDLLDDERQLEGYEELCGLKGHKPFECVGDTLECAILIATLAGQDAWKDDRIVRSLGSRVAPLVPDPARQFAALFDLQPGHRVPKPFLDVLRARP